MPYITLLTDFGLRDGYAGVLKGVIWNILPEAQISDLSHLIPPQDIAAGSLVLADMCFFFPDGTVHVGVVDPGVGTHRRPIAMRLGEHYFVGPDNGLFTRVLDYAEKRSWCIEVVHLDKPEFWRPEISNVFHGRDIFSPVAAHLASGVPLNVVGTPISDPVRLDLPHPEKTAKGWIGAVTGIDHFGNLMTNIPEENLEDSSDWDVWIAGQEIHGLVKTFGDRPKEDLVALIDSSGYLSISVVNGDAAKLLGVKPGDKINVIHRLHR